MLLPNPTVSVADNYLLFNLAIEVKTELSKKAKFSIYHSIYVSTLTYAHEILIIYERARSPDTTKPLHLHIERSQLSCPRRMTQDTLEGLCLSVAWEHLGVPSDSLEEVSVDQEVLASLRRLFPPDPTQDQVVGNE